MTIRFLTGDVFERLSTLPDESVDCIVTSPPYWGLRSYIDKGDPIKKYEIGLEPTLGQHLDVMVRLFDELRRILKPTGTCWVNYGDCYATSPNGRSAAETKEAGGDDRTFRDKPFSTVGEIYPPTSVDPFRRDMGRRGGGQNPATGTLKPKDLCMIPNRLAIALQDAGWWVRSEIVWAKPNPMPESVNDRPGTAHEKIFLLTKNGANAILWVHALSGDWRPTMPEPDYRWKNRHTAEMSETEKEGKDWFRINLWEGRDYYYDDVAVRTRLKESSVTRLAQDLENQAGSTRANGGNKKNGPMKAVCGWGRDKGGVVPNHKPNNREAFRGGTYVHGSQFDNNNPENLLKKRSNKQRGHGRKHAGFNDRWDAMTRNEQQRDGANLKNVWTMPIQGYRGAHFATFPELLPEICIRAGCPPKGVVLDPFGGSGTTGLVADRLGRDAILIELNPQYVGMAIKRIEREAPMLAAIKTD